MLYLSQFHTNQDFVLKYISCNFIYLFSQKLVNHPNSHIQDPQWVVRCFPLSHKTADYAPSTLTIPTQKMKSSLSALSLLDFRNRLPPFLVNEQ